MDPIEVLLRDYIELNNAHVTELSAEPSALEFMRFVALNLPFVAKGAVAKWKATRFWNSDYLREALKDQIVNIAVTPKGNADSPIACDDGTLKFVKPLEEDQSFGEFLDYTVSQELSGTNSEIIRYAQTQNDNLRGEYIALVKDVERDISWARIALRKLPEALNFWLGNSKSVTALHRDNYENIYCQIIGKKHFVLLPPIFSPCVGEKQMEPASYMFQNGVLTTVEDGGKMVRFPTWDPDRPEERATRYSHLARPINVTLEPGDMLYLPAMWYHKVSQSCSEEGICCSVNYWYDMLSYSGSFVPLMEFVQEVTDFI